MAGLTSGLACVILIYLWVSDELKVDHYNVNDARLYEVMQNTVSPNGIQTGPGTPGILAEALQKELPEVEYATSVVPAEWFTEPGILTYDDNRLRARAQYVDHDFFNVFTCHFIEGNPSTSLLNRNDIAISEPMASRLFNSGENPVGKMVEWNMGQMSGLYRISGIFKPAPDNATNHYDLLVNYDIFLDSHPWLKEWGNSDPHTYLIVRKDTDPDKLNAKIHDFIKSKYKDSNQELFLQRFSDRYLHGHYENGKPAGGRIEYVRFFSVIAVFILFIACINFMNLSTARASRRLKEVGIKKAIGVSRGGLISQYFEESLLMAFISMMAAMLLVILLLPTFNNITGKHLSLVLSVDFMLILSGIVLLTGILAGSYPAFYLSGFRPLEILKGKLPGVAGEFWVRRGLVIFQFTMSVILIIAVIIIYRQIEYVQTRNLGYNRDNIIHFDLELQQNQDPDYFKEGGILEHQVSTFLNETRKISGVIDATNYVHDLTGNHGSLGGVDWKPGDEDEQNMFSNLQVGYNFIKTFGIEMAAGRNFSKVIASDRSAIIFNQSAIKLMGINDPIGKTIRLWGEERHIIGVTKDFNFESLYQQVKPCLMQLEPRGFKIAVRIANGTDRETIEQLTKLYHTFYPDLAFDYSFVDEDYQALYISEKRISVIAQGFSLMAIIISSLGLFGLAAFTAERRIKEIGIRKVLGSGNLDIILLLSGDFTRMVLAAIVIAVPFGYFLLKKWLENFAYRIDIHWWYFVMAGMITLLIAWSAVGMQTIRAAQAKPVRCLKDE